MEMKLSPNDNRGFSFFELMVAMVILSAGLVSIYKSFFLILDYTNHLAYRLEAGVLLDEKIAVISHQLEGNNQLAIAHARQTDQVYIANKPIDFVFSYEIHGAENLPGLFVLDIAISWKEGARERSLFRSAFISNYKLST